MSRNREEVHSERCSVDDCPCFLDGERSAKADFHAEKTDLIERLRSALESLEADES